MRPAINVGISVSRVGGNAQIKAMRQVAGRLRLELAQYREMAAFAQFGSDLDKATQAQLARGERLVEILKQGQYVPLTVQVQVLIIYAATNGWVDDYPASVLGQYEEELKHFMENRYADLMKTIATEKMISDELKSRLNEALKEFKEQFVYEEKASLL